MFVHTVIMVIEPHMKQGRQHKLISTIFLATSVTKKLDHNIAYSPAFGEEYEDQLIGHSMNGEIVKSEMKRYITEALMVNPYIKKLENFNFETSSRGMKVTFDCTSIYGKETVPIQMEGVNV